MAEQSMKRKNEEDEDHFIDDDEAPKKSNAKDAKKAKVTGDEMYDIGAKKKVTVGNYKGNLLINIREYYDDKKSGEEKVSTINYYVIGNKKGVTVAVVVGNKIDALIQIYTYRYESKLFE